MNDKAVLTSQFMSTLKPASVVLFPKLTHVKKKTINPNKYEKMLGYAKSANKRKMSKTPLNKIKKLTEKRKK